MKTAREWLSLFAVLVLHHDRIFTAFAVRSGIVLSGFIARNKAKNHNNYDCYCLDTIYQHVHYLHLS